MNTRFISWPFSVTGSSASRTMPDRLNDIINVKDWGAPGDGSNQYAAIQSAIDYCLSPPSCGGIVFFPPGSYALSTNALTVGSNSSTAFAQLLGSGPSNTALSANSTSYIISKGSSLTYDAINRIQGFGLTNTSTSGGAIKIAGTCVTIENCFATALIGIDASDANGALIADCQLGGIDNPLGSASSYPFSLYGVAAYLGNQCMAINCRGTGSQYIGFALSGTGASLLGCAYEVVNYGVRVGWGPNGETPAYACTVQVFQTEQTYNGIDLYNCQGGYISSPNLNATIGTGPQNITNLSWDSTNHLVTATTSSPTFLTAGSTYRIHLTVQPEGLFASGFWREQEFTVITSTGPGATQFTYAGPATDPGAFSGDITSMTYSSSTNKAKVGIVTATPLLTASVIHISTDGTMPSGWLTGNNGTVLVTSGDATSFAYDLSVSSAPAAYGGGSSWHYNSVTWMFPLRYGMRCRKVSETLIQGSWSGHLSLAAIDLDYDGEAQHRNNIIQGLSGDLGWNLPSNLSNLSGWQFLQCGSTGVTTNSESSGTPNPFAALTFANLPGNFTPPFGSTSIYQDGPIEGQEYSIIDSSVTSSGNFAAVISSGGGGNHAKLRYDGSNWRISG